MNMIHTSRALPTYLPMTELPHITLATTNLFPRQKRYHSTDELMSCHKNYENRGVSRVRSHLFSITY
jgi:hypothetical protein